MKKIELALSVSMTLFAPVLVGTSAAQAVWTATSTPIQSTIAGGPWTLGQGGTATTGGAYDGATPYCTPGNSGGGTPLMNAAGIVNKFNPYYFPFIVGSGQNVKGYFDYRPKNVNEAVVEAISSNAGQSWTFQQMAEQLTTECPNSDSNTADDTPGGNPAGNDDGEGHGTLISYGGQNWLYTVDRRSPHVDSDGLIVHNILPRGVNALNPMPANSPFMQPPTGNIIAGWNFNSDTNTATPEPAITGGPTPTFNLNNSPAASTNNVMTSSVPTATALGMTNGYNYTTQAASPNRMLKNSPSV
jgi:hypothetical protein